MAQARTNGKADINDVTAQIDTIKQDIAALTALVTDVATDKKDEAREHAAAQAAAFKSSAADTIADAQEKARAAGERVRSDAEVAYSKAEETVRQQPAMAVGIAAGIGFLVGTMMARRS
ncbi:DUF883 family protein [Roseobacter sinensis]|uniref:DUF883 domain-containing protein n=1 Tax=Roseobacter sinensis TaxID=2931391 RepID=A0ABT3B8P5_9RHOB|nr:DUF883 domain-containing protein [Roseobacter sp. WL0113]MCV3269940.1 DUF883 domain-containing protein [Roseobacter sp. WL0113]